MKKTIIATARNEQQAQLIVEQFRSAKVSLQDVSILFADQTGSQTQATKSTKEKETFGKGKTSVASFWTKEGNVFEEGFHTHVQEGQKGSKEIKGKTVDTAVPLQGSLGVLGNATKINLPSTGFIVVAGPFTKALGGSARTTSVGTTTVFTGTLTGFGINQSDATRLEEKLKKGNFLVVFQADSPTDLNQVKEVFKKLGVQDVVVSMDPAAIQGRGHQ